MKACKICKTKFNAFNSLQVACSPKCALLLVEQKKAKKHKQELAAFRKNDKSLAVLRSDAQKEVNKYIRIRDENKPCISCGDSQGEGDYLTGSKWDASHYRSRGSAQNLAFNCFNIHKSCVYCNRSLSGNIVAYRPKLIEKIGLERVERLENDNAVRRFDREYLIRIKQIFAKRARHLAKIRKNKV